MKKQSNTTRGILKDDVYSTPFCDLRFKCNYPDENPEGTIDNITSALNHLGIFEGINKD